jgi:hypothetical protein
MPYNTFVINGTPLMTFTEFKEQQDARNTIQLNIRKYALMLCDALEMNFKQRNRGELGGRPAPEYKFYIQEGGRKYHKIVMEYDNGSKSVHAFIDKKTGDVFKPASFKAPAKIARYNVLRIESREEMFERADWAGGYLYLR